MTKISNFFMLEIQGEEGIISIDEKDFIRFSNKAKIMTFELNSKTKEWLNVKTLKVKLLIICIFFPERDIPRFSINSISNLLTIFASVEKPIFGIYKKNKQKRIKVTLIFE